MTLDEVVEKKSLDRNKLRLSIGSGGYEYSNCINFELTKERDNKVDIIGDVRKGLPFEENTFVEVLMIHVIEHIERKFHKYVLDEIWRVLKPDGRLILSFPDIIDCMKAFMENRYGRRWELYEKCIWGRQDGTGDYHVTGIERQDITTRLFDCGFINVKYLANSVNATLTAYKGNPLKEYI